MVFGPVVKLVESLVQLLESGVQVDTSVVPVPVAPMYVYPPCTQPLSAYVELGFTATVCVHWALSW